MVHRRLDGSFSVSDGRVLHNYSLPYNPKRPVVCFDERPCFLIGDVLAPIAMSEGKSKREDNQYSKHGSCCVMLALEQHTGKRWVKVYARRTAEEYTNFMQFLSQRLPDADAITLVQDNLNTHQGGSFYKHLEPAAAFQLSGRFDWVYTPKHASWLNMAELEFSALSRQCLDRRICSQDRLEQEVLAWTQARNDAGVTVTWQFSLDAARSKFKRHYESVKT